MKRRIAKEDRQWRGSTRNQGRLFCTIARARCALPLLDLHVRHVAIRASTFAIVIVAGRASNKLWTRFAELSRHITRRMTTIPMEKKIPDSADSHSAGKHAIRNELYRCKWKIWFDASRIIKQSLLSPLFFFYTYLWEFLFRFREREINSRFLKN